MTRIWRSATLAIAIMSAAGLAAAASLEQIVSREHPDFHVANARLTVGRDGLVYLSSGKYLLRLRPDGTGRSDADTMHYASNGIAANRDGLTVEAQGHFAHTAAIFDAGFRRVAGFAELNNENFDAPQCVQAGPSGDFYACDGRAWRIVRLSPAGRVVAVYPLPKSPDDARRITDQFRVAEAAQLMALCGYGQPIRLVGFDGTVRATLPQRGVFDVDDQGNTYVLPHRHSDVVTKFGPDGKKIGQIKLDLGPRVPRRDEETFTALCLAPGGELLVKRNVPTELFERYDLAGGALRGIVPSDHQRLTVGMATDVWTAGQPMALTIEFDPGQHRDAPRWHVYARPFGAPGWRELIAADGRAEVPADFAGLYQVKITPEVTPWQQGPAPEYGVNTVVEVRAPDAKGTACVMTPDNRVWFGRDEDIPITVLVRSPEENRPREVTVQLQECTGDWKPGRVVWEKRARVVVPTLAAGGPDESSTGAGQQQGATKTPLVPNGTPIAKLSVPPTASFRSGHYRLAVVTPGLTCVAQPLILGQDIGQNRREERSFSRLLHGDMGLMTPCDFTGDEAADRVAATLGRWKLLGIDFLVERLGTPLQRELFNADRFNAPTEALRKRLAADPLAVPPEKARQATPLLQSMAAYSAAGIRHMPILLMNDAGLPLGSGFDSRKPVEMLADLERVTRALMPFPAFYGWDWACMWWHFGFGPTPEEKPAFDAAMKKADATGAWDPIIDQVNDRKLKLTTDAISLFNAKLRELAPLGRLKTAAAGPYRKVEAYPPSDFRDLREVDLHYQCEQFAAPYEAIHATDFYRRPGKRCWGHPEIYNDSGTGDQILPFAFMMWMRGPDGVGVQSGLPPIFNGPVNDPRLANRGGHSVLRALNELLGRYGNWSTTLHNNDPVAIVASSRMFRTDRWHSWMGLHFGRILEAFLVCMANHTPASIVFTDDLSPGIFHNRKAVLVVDQRYEPEPGLAAALKEAREAGVPVLYDETCRAEFVKDFTPLGVGFTHFDDGAGANHHDTAYKLMPERIAETLPAVHAKLAKVRPVAIIDNPEIYATERIDPGGNRFVFVVNNANLPLDYGQMWRVSLFSGTRTPLATTITLPAVPKGAAVYEMMAMRQVGVGTGGDLTLPLDLRTLPLRLYAVLKNPIGRLSIAGDSRNGDELNWWGWVMEPGDSQNCVTLPLRVRVIASGGELLDERSGVTYQCGMFDGELKMPSNMPPSPLTVEATELISGKRAAVEVLVTQAEGKPTKLGARARGRSVPSDLEPIEKRFGPHLRDVAVSPDGTLAMFAAHNWDNNLYGVDLAGGKVAWQGRVGHWFAIAPQPLADGFAVQGFDLNTAEGYHLYLTGRDGKPQRRFALYGLPQRLPHRFVPYLVRDRINNFAMPPGGGWVAAAGDLGLAVWSGQGSRNGSPEGDSPIFPAGKSGQSPMQKSGQSPKLLWSHDGWREPGRRRVAALAALGETTLLAADGLQVTAYDAQTGQTRWSLTPAATGEITRAIAAADGRTAALMATTQGGRVFVVRDGKLVKTLSTPDLGDAALSADGSLVAVVRQNQVSLYSADDGFHWTFGAGGTLVGPRFSPDGQRLAIGSEMGLLYVLGVDGRLLLERDLKALPTLAWLPDGDLLAGGWMGTVCRLNRDYRPKWSLHLTPVVTAEREASGGLSQFSRQRRENGTVPFPRLTADEGVPTVRVAGWTNAEPSPLPPGEDLSKTFTVSLKTTLHSTGLNGKEQLLHDGKTDPPAEPWLTWETVDGFAEMSPVNWLQIDTGNQLLRLEGITLYEDPAHPESWLRDASFDRWDGDAGRWVTAMPLLSDAAVHSHRFPAPVEGTRFRILLPWGCDGNVRLGEITLHGRNLGPSHPDVRAKQPVAVVFDENLADITEQYQNGFCPGYKPKSGPEAYSGANYFVIEPWRGDAESIIWPYAQVTHWRFTIAENPEPGEYRWVQFAAKSLSANTRRVTFRPGHPDVSPVARFDHPDERWQTYRVDLWTLLGKPKQARVVTQFLFGVEGGPAAFDQVLLGRTPEDLPQRK